MPAKSTPPIPRFWNKVNKFGPFCGRIGRCWLWQGFVLDTGYGQFVIRGDKRHGTTAHRYSWRIHRGEIPSGLQVLHKCDNRVCVNPSHLFLGTHQDNMDDKCRKNRQVKGELVSQSKLTTPQAHELWRRGM